MRAALYALLITSVGVSGAVPPALPTSFKASIVRHVQEPGRHRGTGRWGGGRGDNDRTGEVITNVTAAYDGDNLRYHIIDYSFGTYYEAWGLFNEQKIYTYSPENIPGPHHCTCLPASSESYLPEFYSLANATLKSINATLDEWVVRGEILSNDTYSVWVLANARNGLAIPTRTLWVDPGPTKSDDTIEQSDYKFSHIGRSPDSEFKPNEGCLKVSC